MDVRLKPTGDLAYRILLDRESIKDDALRAWLDSLIINIWVGLRSGLQYQGRSIVELSTSGKR